jgi:cell division septation protein DedD
MWALNLAEYAADTPPEDAAAVVLYSRVRRMGPNLRGKELTPEFVTKFLSVIGADCECGLDRSWMQGTMLPIRWDSDTQKQVAAALGFDPEDPMTKTEISITISKGARTGGGSTSISPESDFSFGYTEFSPDEALAEEEADGEQPEEVPVETTSPPQPVAEEALAAVAPALETPEAPAPESAPPAEPAPSNLHLLWVLAALGIVAVVGSALVLIRSNRG